MTFEDDLQNQLQSAAETIDVATAASDAIQHRAGRRTVRRRVLTGLGAFVLVAAVAGGGYAALSGGDDEVITVAVADDEQSSDGLAESIGIDEVSDQAVSSLDSRIAGSSGPINYGVLPLDWEVVTTSNSVPIHDIKIDGRLAYGQTRSGWLAVSSDFQTWTTLAVPGEIVAAPPVDERQITGWVNGYDARGGLIVVAVEIFRPNQLAAEQESFDQNPEPIAYDPCSDRSREGGVTSIFVSHNSGADWTTVDVPAVDLPSDRFTSGSATPYVATDGTHVLIGTEQYMNLNVDCVLAEAGVDPAELHAGGGGYGWNQDGVQIYGVPEKDSGDREFEEQLLDEYSWEELGLSDAEIAAVAGGNEDGNTILSQISPDGAITTLDAAPGFVGGLIGLDGEFVLSLFSDSGPQLARSSDGGTNWVIEESTGYIRADISGVLVRQGDGTFDLEVSIDGARAWLPIGSPSGTYVQNLAVIGHTALAGGVRNDFAREDTISVEVGGGSYEQRSYEQSVSLDGFTITVMTDSEIFAITLVDETTGETVLSNKIGVDKLTNPDDMADVMWMRIDDGNVAFFDSDGSEIVTFLESDLDAAFEPSSGTSSAGSGSSSTGSSRIEPAEQVTAEPTEVEATEVQPLPPVEPARTDTAVVTDELCAEGDCGSDGLPQTVDSVLSYRFADGTWITQPVSEIYAEAGWVSSVTALDGVFYVLLEPAFETEADRESTLSRESFSPSILLIGTPTS